MTVSNGKPVLMGCDVLPPLAGQHGRVPGIPTKTKGKAAGDRFRTINAFADFTLATLDRAAIAVWLLLWRDTKTDGLVRTSQADLARRAGACRRTIERAISRLRKRGLLTVIRRGGLQQGASVYRVHALANDPQPDTHVG